MAISGTKRKYRYYWYYLCVDHKENFSAIKCYEQFHEMLRNFTYRGKALDFIKKETSNKIQAFLKEKGMNFYEAQKQLRLVQKKG